MTRLLFVINSLSPWGPAEQLLQLSRRLTEHGNSSLTIQIAVLQAAELPLWATESPLEIISLATPASNKLNRIVSSPDQPISRHNFYSMRALKDLIRRRQPNIVHAWGGAAAWVTQLAHQYSNIQLTLSRSHEDWGAKFFYTELQLLPKKRWSQQWYEQKFCSPFAATIVPHSILKSHLRNHGDTGRIEIIPNRIDDWPANAGESERETVRQSLRQQLKLPVDAKIAGTVAPLIPRTRLKDLIWATDLLTCVRDDFHFLILGTGPQETRLRRFASLTEANRHVHFLGQPANPQPILEGLDFYWHSHLLEPLPTPMLITMASGIPAISVYGPGTQELIRHQKTGFAVNFGARDEFARWTKFLIEQTHPAQQLAQQGQQFVAENFSDDTQTKQYRKVWGLT